MGDEKGGVTLQRSFPFLVARLLSFLLTSLQQVEEKRVLRTDRGEKKDVLAAGTDCEPDTKMKKIIAKCSSSSHCLIFVPFFIYTLCCFTEQ